MTPITYAPISGDIPMNFLEGDLYQKVIDSGIHPERDTIRNPSSAIPLWAVKQLRPHALVRRAIEADKSQIKKLYDEAIAYKYTDSMYDSVS